MPNTEYRIQGDHVGKGSPLKYPMVAFLIFYILVVKSILTPKERKYLFLCSQQQQVIKNTKCPTNPRMDLNFGINLNDACTAIFLKTLVTPSMNNAS